MHKQQLYTYVQMINYCANDAILLTNPFALIEHEIEGHGTFGIFLLRPPVICHTIYHIAQNVGEVKLWCNHSTGIFGRNLPMFSHQCFN